MISEHFKNFTDKFPNLPKTSEREIGLYEAHFALLKSWNENMSLVSRKSIEKSFASHYLDSIFISDFAESKRRNRPIFDLGTGAGFPGVITAIRYPNAEVNIYERMLKKQGFLQVVLTTLNLENIRLGGDFPVERQTGLFLARAVLPPAELFKFMGARMTESSTLILNVGGTSDPIVCGKGFEKTGELYYELPMDCGARRVESFDYVPRGTK